MERHHAHLIGPVVVEPDDVVQRPVDEDREGGPVLVVGAEEVMDAGGFPTSEEVPFVEEEPLLPTLVEDDRKCPR